jgi:hypothetical protein
MNHDEYAYYYFKSSVENKLGDKAGYTGDLDTAASLLNKLQKKKDLNKNQTTMLRAIRKQLKQN